MALVTPLPFRRPTSIKVVSRTYSVEEWDEREAAASSYYGRLLEKDARIQVDASLPSADWARTFQHEVIHAIFREMGLSIQEKILHNLDEEDVTHRIANGLTAVYQDNPWFLGFMAESFGLEARLEGHGSA